MPRNRGHQGCLPAGNTPNNTGYESLLPPRKRCHPVEWGMRPMSDRVNKELMDCFFRRSLGFTPGSPAAEIPRRPHQIHLIRVQPTRLGRRAKRDQSDRARFGPTNSGGSPPGRSRIREIYPIHQVLASQLQAFSEHVNRFTKACGKFAPSTSTKSRNDRTNERNITTV
jgi:hypothetical protein